MIYLNNIYFTKKKTKNKHLSFDLYEKIQSEYNRYIQSSKMKMKKTVFMKYLSKVIGTSLSNLYEIINDGLITVRGYEEEDVIEFNAYSAFNKRTKKSIESNSSKRLSSQKFVDLVIKEFRSNMNINSIDEIINDFIHNRHDEINGMETICTSTFYNYVELDKIPNFSKYELPMKTKLKKKSERQKGKTEPKGISIELRPFSPKDRSDFGHREGDTIVSGESSKNGAILTLVERTTRFQVVVPLKDLKANTVLKAFYKIKSLYPDFDSKAVFKSITFDNGVEFSYWKKIQIYLNTNIYFAHPYSAWECGSNENCNRLLRLFIPKSSFIKYYSLDFIMNANELINQKIRKILNYKSSLELFNIELDKLAQ